MEKIIISFNESINNKAREELRKHIVSLCNLLGNDLINVDTDSEYNIFGAKQ